MTPTPTGRRETRDGSTQLVLTRTFAAPITDVWAAVTESERLGRWIGTWAGDPASGQVEFTMVAEGADTAAMTYRIDVCDPPRRLVVRTGAGGDGWLLSLDLAVVPSSSPEDRTTLTFTQLLTDSDAAADIGPGWEYYLDRLVAAETDGRVAAVDWDDYYPAQAEYYRNEFR